MRIDARVIELSLFAYVPLLFLTLIPRFTLRPSLPS